MIEHHITSSNEPYRLCFGYLFSEFLFLIFIYLNYSSKCLPLMANIPIAITTLISNTMIIFQLNFYYNSLKYTYD